METEVVERSSATGGRGRCMIRCCRPRKRCLTNTLAIYPADLGADTVSKAVARRIQNEVHFDFANLGKIDEPMLVIRERITDVTMASTVRTKSAGTCITCRTLCCRSQSNKSYERKERNNDVRFP